MRRIWKYAVAVTVMCLAFSMNVSAKDYLTQENFDYEWYIQKHPALAATINVNDQEAIWNYYRHNPSICKDCDGFYHTFVL